jgi:hypothetical protein
MSSHGGKILFDDQYEYLGMDERGMYVFKHKTYGDILHLRDKPRFRKRDTNQGIQLNPDITYYVMKL